MNSYFVDTSFWKGLVDKRDSSHKEVKASFSSLSPENLLLYTTDYVFTETVTLLRLRQGLGLPVAKKWGESILSSAAVNLIHVDESLFTQAWEIFKKYEDKKFSFVDCTSFAVMEKYILNHALTLDHHFDQYGFITTP